MANSAVRIVHIITDLDTGGAEMMLYKLLSHMDRKRFEPAVISLMAGGTVRDRIESLGIPVYSLDMKQGIPSISAVWRLRALVRQLRPNLLQGWMYHGNLTAQLASAFQLGQIPVIWNIRQSLYDLRYEKKTTALIIRLGARLSYFPACILYNSQISAQQHESLGYQPRKTHLIANGFDLTKFTSSLAAREQIRSELGLPEKSLLIGLIGRYHPMKDHATFLQAAAALRQHLPSQSVQFLLVGQRVDWENETLVAIARNLNLTNHLHLLGERSDIPNITAALDIATSSSYAEAFPNTIGEAMCCGVPCTVTAVGDSAKIVGETGKVVPPRDPQALATGWEQLIDLGRKGRESLGQLARDRIQQHFSLNAIATQYADLYRKVLAESDSRPR